MKNNIKHSVAKVLILIFLIPILSKGLDVVFHKHDDFVCTAKHEKHIHQQHDLCSVSTFIFLDFILKTNVLVLTKPIAHTVNKPSFYFSINTTAANFSFSLRAPPIV